jgi:putative GTP pyrophosphokinase
MGRLASTLGLGTGIRSAHPTSNRTHMTDTAVDEFAHRRHEYVRFTSKLELLLRDLLAAEKIDFHLLESRTKEVTSFRDKVARTSKAYRDPLSEVTDLCGLRVIAYYQDQVDAIGRLISAEFLVDDENSLIHAASGAEFGYKSSHFVVRLKQDRGALREWQGLAAFVAEIQVRTVLQHAWAAISHKLQYKREEDIPQLLRRKLFRLSALFEIADDEFVSLRDESSAVKKEIVDQLIGGNRKLALDAVSLGQLLATSPGVAEICAYAAEAGFNFDPADLDPDDDDGEDDRISDLLKLANIAGLQTVEDFDAMLDDALEWSKDYLLAQYQANSNISPGNWYVTPPFICELLLLHAHRSSIRLGHLLVSGYSRESGKRIYGVAQSFKRAEA